MAHFCILFAYVTNEMKRHPLYMMFWGTAGFPCKKCRTWEREKEKEREKQLYNILAYLLRLWWIWILYRNILRSFVRILLSDSQLLWQTFYRFARTMLNCFINTGNVVDWFLLFPFYQQGLSYCWSHYQYFQTSGPACLSLICLCFACNWISHVNWTAFALHCL